MDMQRFRTSKKSDPSRTFSALHDNSNSFPQPSGDDHSPGLPSADAFRTSLILPELARRFTLLRTSSGDPVSLGDLKLKFAEQRARGVLNQISEAEEDMILQTLGRIRSKHSSSTSHLDRGDPSIGGASEAGIDSDYTPERSSHLSSNTTSTTYPASSITSSPRSTKRYSNNLFSSGRLRDYGYLRTISQRSHRSAASIIQTESSQSLREETSLNSIESLRPTTPDRVGSVSPPSSPNDKTPVARTASLVSSNDDLLPQPSVENGSSLPLSKRASAALAQVIKEFEEPEDLIVMPRTAHPVPRFSDSDHSRVTNDAKERPEPGFSPTHHRSSSDFEAGTAISPDGQISIDSDTRGISPTPHGRSGTASPTPRLPGYIPGMPRPMTPREAAFDTEDIRSHSTTPRASSPNTSANGQSSHSSISSGLLRRGSDASRSTPRPTSPQVHTSMNSYLSRSNSEKRTPDTQRESTSGGEQEGPATSSVFIRRRPISPLSGPAFQPMAVSPRPSTPSNITWTVGGSASPEKARIKSESRSTHSSGGSQSTETDFQINMDRSKSPTRSLRSPVPPESPGPAQTTSASKWNSSVSPGDSRAPSSLSSHDFGSSLSLGSRGLRSPTPTQTRNASSSTFPSPDPNSNVTRSTKQHFKSISNYSYGVSQLSLSPIANSSRSSLESTGSSYHSWEPNQKIGGALDIFSSAVGQTLPMWYSLDKSVSLTPGSSQDECDFEGIIRRYAGLTKSDFVAIQEKLVGAAVHKATLPDTRERTNSLRRRRPSTSQSNYSTTGRIVSVTPTQNGPVGRRSPALDNNAKASALLESVVDSIPVTHIDTKVEDKVEPELSPTTRRNRDLARALGFGNDGSDQLIVPQVSRSDSSSTSVALTIEAILPPESPQEMENIVPLSARQPQFEALSPVKLPQRSQSMRSPRSAPFDQTELAREVQRKADAATAALMKSSGRKFADVNISAISISRKKIDPSQISEPRLLSAPTSVETIPLPAQTSPLPLSPQPSLGITQRMRRLRNTLRVKPTTLSGEEATSFSSDFQPQPQGLNRRPTLPFPRFGPGSSIELAKFKTSSTSPPASAAPGFKGLMARFRKPRTMDSTGDSQSSMHSRSSPTTSSPTASSHQGHTRGNVPSSGPPTAINAPSSDTSARPSLDTSTVLAHSVDSTAVKQLFEAASKIGLDQTALNDLLTRSTSVSRAAGWVWPGGTSATSNTLLTPSILPPSILDRNHADQHTSDDFVSSGTDTKTVRKQSVRKVAESGQIRQSRQIPESATILRRTLIFPSEFRSSKVDLSQLNRKAVIQRHRRSGSATSAQSTRSVHDRAPTPPPPKGNGGRRFSTERSPPVPGLTSIGAQAEMLLRASPPDAAAEKQNSAYDSLYDMYTGESKHTSTVVDDAGVGRGLDSIPAQEGPAVEVIEMANGETIWQIVNGLRDDDIDSVYPGRTSMGSDHSTRENGDNIQLVVREHARSTSKSSSASIDSPKRTSQSRYRPETKVFYGSSAQIGRLIESLSQGMDAGSFNFILNQTPTHSTAGFYTDTDPQWTAEEKLDHLLGAMRNP